MLNDAADILKVEDLLLRFTKVKHEIIGPTSNVFTHDTDWFGMAGIKLKKSSNTWHWFKFNASHAPFFNFNQSYSQASGKMKGRRAFAHARKVRTAVANLIGLEPQVI